MFKLNFMWVIVLNTLIGFWIILLFDFAIRLFYKIKLKSKKAMLEMFSECSKDTKKHLSDGLKERSLIQSLIDVVISIGYLTFWPIGAPIYINHRIRKLKSFYDKTKNIYNRKRNPHKRGSSFSQHGQCL